METIETQNPIASRGRIIAAVCVLIFLAGFLALSRTLTAPPVASTPPVTAPPVVEATSSQSGAPTPEPRVTFAHTMPRAQGTQIYNNEGTPNLSMVMVAIPDGPKSVRFVRGNTPEAVRYLAETKARQDLMVVDRGPEHVDTSENPNYGPLKGRATRRVRLGADVK